MLIKDTDSARGINVIISFVSVLCEGKSIESIIYFSRVNSYRYRLWLKSLLMTISVIAVDYALKFALMKYWLKGGMAVPL